MRVLVTGGTGYVGSLLVPRLVSEGHDVTCLVRDPARVPSAWREAIGIVTGQVGHAQAVFRAADGCDVAVYLVHGMDGAVGDLVTRERVLARAFREGIELAGVRRVVYLGGLVDEAGLGTVSAHLYARHQTGEELRGGPVPVTEVRAGIVLGAASASFRLLAAAARSSLAPDTSWARSRTQPIAPDDLLSVLVAVLDDPWARRRVLEVGGPDVVDYGDLVARVRAFMGRGGALRVPMSRLPPEALAGAAAVAAGIDTRLALGLLQSARVDTVVTDDAARRRYSGLLGTSVDQAIRAALFEDGCRTA